jgi:hypothetical protein
MQKYFFSHLIEPFLMQWVTTTTNSKSMTMKKIALNLAVTLCLSILSVFSTYTHAQSISGNVNSLASKTHLAYGNVDIYKGSTLVATVLTDREGNFHVKLDTGTYRCVIQYAGHEKVEKTFKVTKDEKADFALKTDASSKYKAVSTTTKSESATTTRSSSYSGETTKEKKITPAKSGAPVFDGVGISSGYVSSHDYTSDYLGGAIEATLTTGKYGVLTAGEINDFSKWTLWKDIVKKDLKTHSEFWQMAIKGRYTLQLTSQNGLPLADAIVKLMTRDKTVYQSRTDNTGKAELWVGLEIDSTNLNEKYPD